MPKDFLRKSWWINFAIIFCFLLLLPVISPSFRVPLYGKYLSFAFVALGIVLSWGYCGILSQGQPISVLDLIALMTELSSHPNLKPVVAG